MSRDATPPRLSIRMYRHGLGDCLLLRFAKAEGNDTFNILIDCGLIGVAKEPKVKMAAVVASLREDCGGRLDVVVMTHEHWDHVSGFSTQQAQAAFDELEIGEVWYAWTEDPTNALGRKLRREREAKVKALSVAVQALSKTLQPLAARRAENVGRLLSFFGVGMAAAKSGKASIGKTRAAFEYLADRAGTRVRYRHPKEGPMRLRGVDNVRVYAFGPPEDEVMLKKSRPTKSGREVYELSGDLGLTASLDHAFARLGADAGTHITPDCPFEESCNRRTADAHSEALSQLRAETWDDPEQDWRRIELDWTQSAETMAIDLDSHTNNSCLVLAFEFTDTGEVFLFPADAQIGNWLSWEALKWKVGGEWITAHDLLARTVFYKVGHHGSHNATLRSLGLELMTSEDLTAVIPVFEAEALKNRWKEMPFKPLVKRLTEKTRGRVLRSDDKKIPTDTELKLLSVAERAAFRRAVRLSEDELYYEVRFD